MSKKVSSFVRKCPLSWEVKRAGCVLAANAGKGLGPRDFVVREDEGNFVSVGSGGWRRGAVGSWGDAAGRGLRLIPIASTGDYGTVRLLLGKKLPECKQVRPRQLAYTAEAVG